MLLTTLARWFRKRGWEVHDYLSVDAARAAIPFLPALDVAILNHHCNDECAFELFGPLREHHPLVGFVLVSDYLNARLIAALEAEDGHLCPGPLDPDTLMRLCLVAATRYSLSILHDIQLTHDEARLLQLARGGRSNGDIGRAMQISERMVQQHWRRVFRKTGLSSRREVLGFLSKPQAKRRELVRV